MNKAKRTPPQVPPAKSSPPPKIEEGLPKEESTPQKKDYLGLGLIFMLVFMLALLFFLLVGVPE